MIPNTQLRLTTMLRAMHKIILPALPANNSLAIEQAQLLAGHLNLLLEQGGRETEIVQQETEQLIALAKSLLAITGDGDEKLENAKSAVNTALQYDSPLLSVAIEDLILSADETYMQAAWPLIMSHASDAAEHGRQWFKATGMW